MHIRWISRHRNALSIAFILVATSAVYWPAMRSFFVLDDFFLAAISRLVGDPWAFFIHNHFPGGAFYRPLGMALWWLSIELFGLSPRGHYLLNLALHIGVGIALWRVLCLWTSARAVTLLATLLFVLHPIAIGTSLWLSDRFDLLAALFGLFAIEAAWRYRKTNGNVALGVIFICLLLAPLAKEIGFAAYAPATLILLWPASATRSSIWTPQCKAAVALTLVAIGLFAWRSFVLGGALEHHFVGDVSVFMMITEGAEHGAQNFFVYTLELARLSTSGRIAVIAGTLLFLGWLIANLARTNAAVWHGEKSLAVVSALGLILAACVLQAPTLRLMGFSNGAPAALPMATDSRMFYLALIGLAMLVCGLVNIALDSTMPRNVSRGVVMAAALLCILPWASDAHRLAREYRKDSYTQMQLIRATQTAIAQLPLPAQHCRIYLLDVPQQQEFTFSKQIDAAVRALSPEPNRAQHCLLQTDVTPWLYVLKRGLLTADSIAPMRQVSLDGGAAPSLQYGNVEIAYLNLDAASDPRQQTDAFFLAYRSERFVDVTPEVLSGQHAVKFRCDRPGQQCTAPGTQAPQSATTTR